MWSGIIFIIITGLVTVLNRNKLNKVLKRAVFILLGLTIVMQVNFVSFAITHMNLNYDAYIDDKEFRSLKYPLYDPVEKGGFTNPETKEQKDSLQVSAKRFTAFLMQNPRYTHLLNDEAWDAYHSSEDKVVLEEALVWIKKDIEQTKHFNNMDTYLRLLLKLEHWKEAEKIAIETIELGKKEERETEEIEGLLLDSRENLAKQNSSSSLISD